MKGVIQMKQYVIFSLGIVGGLAVMLTLFAIGLPAIVEARDTHPYDALGITTPLHTDQLALQSTVGTTITYQVPAPEGCDSLITMELIFNPPPEQSITVEVCAGEFVSVNGRSIASDTLLRIENLSGGCDTLLEVTRLPKGKYEALESLEQLRWLENGFRIHVGVTELETIGIDTPDDLEKVKHLYKKE